MKNKKINLILIGLTILFIFAPFKNIQSIKNNFADVNLNDLNEWTTISGEWKTSSDGLHLKTTGFLSCSPPLPALVSKKTFPDNTIITFKAKGNAIDDVADTSLGFYSDANASSYWIFDLGSCENLGMSYVDAGKKNILINGCNVNTLQTSNNKWFNIKVYINNGNFYAKVWEYETSEPEKHQIERFWSEEKSQWILRYWDTLTNIWKKVKDPGGNDPSKKMIFGNHIIIGSSCGQDEEEYWFQTLTKKCDNVCLEGTNNLYSQRYSIAEAKCILDRLLRQNSMSCGYEPVISGPCQKLVPCKDDCKLSDIFIMIQNIVNCLVFISVNICLLFIVIGGLLYIFSLGNPENLTKAKNTILWALGGLALVFLAWLIVNTMMYWMGVDESFLMWNSVG